MYFLKEFVTAAKKYWNNKTLGIREILSIDDEKQPNGKVFKKLSLGGYKWSTYENTYEKVNNLSNGLLNLGLKSNSPAVLFAETQPQWLIGALACFRIKVPVVTLYSTLGTEALTYGINQTNTTVVITSGEQLSKLQKILPRIPSVTHIVVMCNRFTHKHVLEFRKNTNQVQVFTMEEVQEIGVESPLIEDYEKPKRDDVAIIMYTSKSENPIKICGHII